jgi:transcription elongation factor Elf1
MYLELLRMRNKPIDIKEMRKKHDLLDEPAVKVFEISASEPAEMFEVIEQLVEDEQFSEILPEVQDEAEKSKKATEEPAVLSPPPKILNPTIIPRIVNTTRMELFKCDFCSHSASTKLSMERHMKQIHLRTKSKLIFSCKVCSKAFAKSTVLKIHEKIHMDHRPTYECQQCGKVLSSQTAVTNHIRWLHAEKEFECPVCQKKFATVSLLLSPLTTNNSNFISERSDEGA